MDIESGQFYYLLERLTQLKRHALVAQLCISYEDPTCWEPRLASFYTHALIGLGRYRKATAFLSSSGLLQRHPGPMKHLLGLIEEDIGNNPFISADRQRVQNLRQDMSYSSRLDQIKALIFIGDNNSAKSELAAIYKRFPGRHEPSDLIWALESFNGPKKHLSGLIKRAEDLVNDFTDEDITVVDTEGDEPDLFLEDDPTEGQGDPSPNDEITVPSSQIMVQFEAKEPEVASAIGSRFSLRSAVYVGFIALLLSCMAGGALFYLNQQRVSSIRSQASAALFSASQKDLLSFKRIMEHQVQESNLHTELYGANLALSCAILYRDFNPTPDLKLCAEKQPTSTEYSDLYLAAEINMLLAAGKWDKARELISKGGESPMLQSLNVEIKLHFNEPVNVESASPREIIAQLEMGQRVDGISHNLWARLIRLELDWAVMSQAERQKEIDGLSAGRHFLGDIHNSRLLILRARLANKRHATRLRKEAYRLDPDNLDNIFVIGFDAFEKGDARTAESFLSKCQSESKDCAQILFLMYMESDRLDDASQLWESHLSQTESADELKNWLDWSIGGFQKIAFKGFIADYFNLKLFDTSKDSLKKVLYNRILSARKTVKLRKAFSKSVDVNLLIAHHLYSKGKLKQGLHYVEGAVSANPNHPLAWRTLILFYQKMNRKKSEIKQVMNAYLRLKPNGAHVGQLRDMFE